MPAGARRSFVYDWDDIPVAELLIVPSQGPAREIVVDSHPTVRQYRRPATNRFVVPALETLPLARPEVLAVRDNFPYVGIAAFMALGLIGIGAPFGVVYARRRLRANRSDAEWKRGPPIDALPPDTAGFSPGRVAHESQGTARWKAE